MKNKKIDWNQEEILLYKLPYYVINKDSSSFDYAIASISDSNELLYSSKLVKLIYDYYVERSLENLAFQYLNRASNFFKKAGKTVPAIVNKLLVNPNNETLVKLRGAFKNIITSHYKQIPLITPQNINDKRELRFFILNELIKSLKQLQDRIKIIHNEDDYTDLIRSILLMRFPFYGWNISGQDRQGESPSGKRPGEIDLVVKASDENIALVEAFILEGSNFKKTKEHILKCFGYSKQTDQYYIIIYYRGKKDKFDSNWDKYKENVKKISFPKGKILKKPKSPFVNLNSKFDNIQSFKVLKTCHKSNFEMFHIMVDFSDKIRPKKQNQTKKNKKVRVKSKP
jgi:hypothetical protein